jgi:flagellar biosynthesis/type III secretory pathway M-ring protein FliF/YscJ
MEATTCIVLVVLILAWVTVRVCELYFRRPRYFELIKTEEPDESKEESETTPTDEPEVTR